MKVNLISYHYFVSAKLLLLLSISFVLVSFLSATQIKAAVEAPTGDENTKCTTEQVILLDRAKTAHDLEAMYQIGTAFVNKKCTQLNVDRSLFWLKKAAASQHAQAAFDLGVHYAVNTENTYGTLKNYRIAALQDHAEAQHELGMTLLSIERSDTSVNEGLYWLGTASSSGSTFSALV